MASIENRYKKIIEKILSKYYKEGIKSFYFKRDDIVEAAKQINIQLPKNLDDVIYSFRYRIKFPKTIISKTPKGYAWIIKPAGISQYKFVLTKNAVFVPNHNLAKIKYQMLHHE